jgi:short-subunit dehydrogenase
VISPKIDGLQCDVADPGSVSEMAERVLQRNGCPDILVNSAGFATYRTVAASDVEELERLVAVNFLGAVRCTKAFLPAVMGRGSGAIVNVSSIAGRLIITPNGTYCASKHALVAWSEVLKYELADRGVHVHAICPGRVETSFFDHETFQRRSQRREPGYTISVDDVSRATIEAIQRNQFLTYVPRSFGLLVWLTNALPFVVKPVYARLLLSRLRDMYKQEAAVTASGGGVAL